MYFDCPPRRRARPLAFTWILSLPVVLLVLLVPLLAFAQTLPDPTPAQPLLQQILDALAVKSPLLPALVVVALYVRKLVGPDSKFPVTIPHAWAPIVSSAAGLAYGLLSSLAAGVSPLAAAIAMLAAAAASGFLDGLLTAIFADPAKVPWWAKALVFLFDDSMGGGGSGNAAGAGQSSAMVTSIKPPPASARVTLRPRFAVGLLWARRALVGGGAVLLMGCAPWLQSLNAWDQSAQGTVLAAEKIGDAVVAGAAAAFQAIEPSLPAADQAKATADFDAVRAGYATAESALNDLLAAGGDVTSPTPQITAAIAAFVDAAGRVYAFVESLTATAKTASLGQAKADLVKLTNGWGSQLAKAHLAPAGHK